MISRAALSKYLRRPLFNAHKVKSLSRKQCMDIIGGYDVQPNFETEPRLAQLHAFLCLSKFKGFTLLLDMGLGKTKVALDSFEWRQAKDEAGRMLVLVPNSTNCVDWEDEVRIHQPELRAKGLDASCGAEERKEAFWGDEYDVVICTYLGLCHLLCEKVGIMVEKEDENGQPVLDEKGKPVWEDSGKSEMQVSDKLINRASKIFDMMVLDESTFVRNHQKLYFKVCKKLSRLMPFTYCMTGTAFGKDPQAVWPQFLVADGGETFGTTMGLFREAFFTIREKYIGVEYVFKKNMQKVFTKMLRHRSLRYEIDECMDMPDAVECPNTLNFSEEAWTYYEKLIAEMEEARGNFELVDSVYYRMRTIASGYLPYDDPMGARKYITFKENPKLEDLSERLKTLPDKRKMIIIYKYDYTGDLICERLKKEKVSHVRICGKTSGAAKKDAQRRFKAEGKAPWVLVLNESSGSYGLNMQVANYMYFFELPEDPMVWQQAMKRTLRGGQTRTCFYYFPLLRNSYDKKALKALRAGKKLLHDLVKK